MVAGARLAVEAGYEIRGSDNPLYPPTSEMVKSLGVEVYEGFQAENLDWDPALVVIGNALSRGNAEVEAVLERGIPYQSLAEWIKNALLWERQPVVLTGTHGKTTTTAITAHLLDQAGLSPGFLIGGQPLNFKHSSRLGARGAPFVIEGDEYDTAFFDKRAKFFHYLPRVAVVTSLEFDHGDIYDSIEDIELAFQRMLRQIPASGHAILCADSDRAVALKDHAFSHVTTYGFAEAAEWRIEDRGWSDGFQRFALFRKGAEWGVFQTTLVGAHNIQNAAAALIVSALHGIAPDKLAESLASFAGIKRRMEVFHEFGGVTFVDDFAHHPTAIQGTIAAARTRWPKARLVVLFEPRSNTTVTNRFQDSLTKALSGADVVWIGPIHRGDRLPPEDRLDRVRLVAELERSGGVANFSDDVDEIVGRVHLDAREGDLTLALSNGAFGGIYEQIKLSFS